MPALTALDIIKSAFWRMQQNGLSIASLGATKCPYFISLSDKISAYGKRNEELCYGLAFSNNVEQVKDLLEHCPSEEKKLCTAHAIRGFARAGNFAAIHEIPNYRDYEAERILGLAQAGNKELVSKALDKNIALFDCAVRGYAEGNHEEALKALIKGTCYYRQAIEYATQAGQYSLVNSLLEECNVPSSYTVDGFALKNQKDISDGEGRSDISFVVRVFCHELGLECLSSSSSLTL